MSTEKTYAKKRTKRKNKRRKRLKPAPPAALVGAIRREIKAASPFPPNVVADKLDLRVDLGLTDTLKRSLARPFQGLARAYRPTAEITRDDCSKLKIVKDAVVLVSARAGFEYVG